MKKVIALVAVVAVLLTGCVEVIEGVPQEEYDALKEAYDQVVAERDALLRGEQTTESETTEHGSEYLVRSVSEMMNELDANALNAKEFYTDKYVEITGRVDVIDANGKYICLYPPDNEWAFTGVQCSVETKEQLEAVKKISTGDIVTLRGEITMVGEVLGYYLDIHSFVE